MKSESVVITDKATGKSVECPVLHGTYGAPVIDINAIYRELGMFTFDPGFASTASCRSAITYLDGENGVLMHRGYPIEQLAKHSTYIELCYLLLHGELPSQTELDDFRVTVRAESIIHEHMNHLFHGYRDNAHPMSMMLGALGAMASYHHEKLNIRDPENRELTCRRIIGKMSNLAAKCYRYSKGLPFNFPNRELGYTENFMQMMFAMPCESYEPDPNALRALDLLLILHADHEQNASTSAVRLAGSAEASPYAAVAAGIATLWGKAHGGANEAVLHMLYEIGDHSNIPKFIARAKDKDDTFRLMGFGHRVYKNHDPRATIIREACHAVIDNMATSDEAWLFQTAMELEKIALEDEYFIERKLYPNVDFYSGIILKALGIPLSMYTVMFAMARSVGWIAQWKELMEDPDFRIGRPRQLFIGAEQRDYRPIAER